MEGTWKGEVSSVHCDLLEGGESGKPLRWWDRSVGTQMGWSERIFAQEFVAAEGSEGGEPLDRRASYAVRCSARFSGGWQVSDSARVEGTPPGWGARSLYTRPWGRGLLETSPVRDSRKFASGLGRWHHARI